MDTCLYYTLLVTVTRALHVKGLLSVQSSHAFNVVTVHESMAQ